MDSCIQRKPEHLFLFLLTRMVPYLVRMGKPMYTSCVDEMSEDFLFVHNAFLDTSNNTIQFDAKPYNYHIITTPYNTSTKQNNAIQYNSISHVPKVPTFKV